MTRFRYTIAAITLCACACITHATDLFAFQNGLRGAPKDSLTMLSDMGYGGICSIYPKNLKVYQDAAKGTNQRVLSVYAGGKLTANGYTYDPMIPGVLDLLKDSDAILEFTIMGKGLDKHAVAMVQEVADMAKQRNVKVALYPHAGFFVATSTKAIEIAKKANRDNVGIVFNLCHFLKSEKADDLEAIIKNNGPLIFHVSTNGADLGGNNWKTLIQPLNKGTFPQERLIKALSSINYRGQVGLQCYGIKEAPAAHLKASADAWKALQKSTHE